MLSELLLKGVYKSDYDDILRDFYIPVLSRAYRYDRAVGFFSASTLSHAAQALSAFLTNGGYMRLIVGAFSDESDINAIKEGLRQKEISDALGVEFLDQLGSVTDELFQHRFEALAWLIANGRLEVKVALRPRGMYHDKVGVVSDREGNSIVFAGSANESASALLPTLNYESIDVFPSWKQGAADWHDPHRASFERLWENRSPGTAVIDIPTAVREKLLEVAAGLTRAPNVEREEAIVTQLKLAEQSRVFQDRPIGPTLPETINGFPFQLKDHQRAALNSWRAKGDFHGILDLATGAGKTITAIYAIVQMAQKIPGLVVVVAAPYQNLADQWCDILDVFNIQPLQCYISKDLWHDELKKRILHIKTGASNFEAIVVVNRTLQSDEFQTALASVPGDRLLWIGDECHHHGSEAFSKALPTHARFRLGLSATPDHYLDVDKNGRLEQFYGSTVFTYSLKQAIEDSVLTPYNYFPAIVELTDHEAAEFIALSDEISRQFARNGVNGKPTSGLKALLMKRARLVGAAANKLSALAKTLQSQSPENHTLFYCGDGSVEVDDLEDSDDTGTDDFPTRQIEVVCELVDKLHWRVSRFTARESRRDRKSILQNFKDGLIDGMVAIKCLDEGIDVPACRTAYILASSRDPRQFIQRRGRILRRSPGKVLATIFDYVVVLPPNMASVSTAARNLVIGELRRVAEFSSLAENRFLAYEALRPTLLEYDLEHLL